jgi:hypothetical protein
LFEVSDKVGGKYISTEDSLVFTKNIIGLSRVELFRIWENFFAHRYW